MSHEQNFFIKINFPTFSSGATTVNLPAGVLYRVKATYRYVREDTDELSFEAGDIIDVIEYEDPEDQVRYHIFQLNHITQHL